MKWCITLSGVMGAASSDRDKTSEVLGQENLTMPARGRCSWGLGIALAFGIGGAITYSCDRSLAQSNIVPDSTLGNENSIVVPNFNGLPVEAIGGGAVRGQNLFHSFQEFNVNTGRGAYFFSPSSDIENILARVTGNNLSQILGTLGTFGNSQPNLFLINPNGIIFGQNASLDVGGSFVATTANAIRLGDTGLFSASEPQTSNLLSINPSAFFFNSLASQAQIVNRSTATTTVLDAPTSGLQVPDGRSLLLVGGDVRLNGGRLFAPGGRVELGGVQENGTVELNGNGNELRLSFPDDVARADVSLLYRSELDVVAGNGGSIAINARNLDVLGESKLRAGIGSGRGSVDSQAGDITLSATGAIRIGQSSRIENDVNQNATGNSGNIRITTASLSLFDRANISTSTFGRGNGGSIDINTRSLSVTNGAQLNANSSGQGNAGSINITATDSVSFDDVGRTGELSAAFSQVSSGGVGNAGNINITTRSLSLTNGAQVSATTFGRGNAGIVNISATDSVSFDGVGRTGFSSGPGSGVEAGAVGNAGSVNINTRSLSVTNGATLRASTSGQGNAGVVNITATDSVSLDGVNRNGRSSAVLSNVNSEAVGNGGNLNINTRSLSVTNGAQLTANTSGQGNAGSINITATDSVFFDGVGSNRELSAAFSQVRSRGVGNGGNVNINTRSLSLTNGGQVSATTFGQGNAGSVNITATDSVSFDGVSRNGFSSGPGSGVEAGAVGNAGSVNINTRSLSVTNGATLRASTSGRGNAGSIDITATDSVFFDGVNRNGRSSGAFSQVNSTGVGNGGNVNINTRSLSVTNGAQLTATTYGEGNAGSVNIAATDSVSFDGVGRYGRSTGVFSTVEGGAVGNSGDINIQAGSLSLTNGAAVNASTFGQGSAGNVVIAARETISLDGVGSRGFSSGVFSTVARGAVGKGGDINIQAGSLSLTNGAAVNASTFGQGNAGNVAIAARETISLDGVGSHGFSSGVFSTVAKGAAGNGGNINIQAGSLSLTNGAVVNASTSGQGNAGNVAIATHDNISMDGVGSNASSSGIFSRVAKGAVGNNGNINIQAGSLFLSNGALVSASTSGQGNGGNVALAVRNNLSLDGVGSNRESSGIYSSVCCEAVGKGGDIYIQAGSLSLTNGATVNASTFGQGNAGNVVIAVRENISLDGVGSYGSSRIVSSVEEGAAGDGGDINITARSLSLTNGALITSQSDGTGSAGDIIIQADQNLELNRSSIAATTRSGNGGDMTLQVGDLLLMRNNSLISTEAGTAQQGGDGGNIRINAGFVVAVPREDSDIVANAYEGRGGNINITTQGIFGLEFRENRTPLSDITASSQLGVDGEVTVNTLGVDPSRGLAELPTNVVDATEQIDRRCTPSSTQERSSFTITGRGGLPPSPNDPLQGESVVTNWVSLDSEVETNTPPARTTPKSSAPRQLVEAQGWYFNEKGEVVLTASAPKVTPQGEWLSPPECNPDKSQKSKVKSQKSF